MAAALAVLACIGCSQYRSAEFSRPPAAATANAKKRPVTGARSAHLVVIGHFRTPAHPLRWGAVGPGMGEAIARTLLNHGKFDVWMNPSLAKRVDALTGLSAGDRARQLSAIQRAFPDVRFVVNGKVTDFHHTTDVMLGTMNRNADEARAIVAIRLDVFDLKVGRVVASDHVYGATSAPNVPSDELYAGVSFDSYLFWSTPLGAASDRAIRASIEVLTRVAESGNETIRIVQRLSDRRVRIVGGLPEQLKNAPNFYVYLPESVEPVRDRDTQRPVQARIEKGDRSGRTAWLLGEVEPEVDLRGALLRVTPPGRHLSREPSPEAAKAVTSVDTTPDAKSTRRRR